MRFCEIFLLLVASMSRANAATRKAYPNGCVLTRSDSKDIYRDTLETPYPSLNCSYLGKSSFNLNEFPEDIASISLAHNNLTTFDTTVLSRFRNLVKLDLRSNKISTLKSADVSAKSITYLYLSFNQLTEIPEELCSTFPSSHYIDLSANHISVIRSNDFSLCKRMAILHLASNPLGDIPDGAFGNTSSTLAVLSLSFTGRREVPKFVSSMPKLRFLSLANNEITNIRASSFSDTTYLEWLELASNKIVTIDPRAFAGTKRLHFLDLTDNRIESLQSGVFDSMAEEEQLIIEMYENPLRCDCSLKWLKLWTDSLDFRDIRFKCMQPKRIHGKKSYELVGSDFTCDPSERDWSDDCQKSESEQKEATSPSPSPRDKSPESTSCPKTCKCFNSKGVQYYPEASQSNVTSPGRRRLWYLRDATFPHVDCSHAKLVTLPTDIRKDVRTLTLEENSLGTISIDDLKPYSSLVMLDLEGCGLREIVPSTTGVTFPNLTTLLIHRNKLTSLGRDVLKSFPKLKILRMYHNEISSFPGDMFSSNKFLNRLYIGSNPVKEFDSSFLAGLDLYSLSLRNMNLTQIPLIKSENMTYLELSDNSITVIRNNTFVSTPTLFRLTIDNNLVSTIEPAAFNKTSKLRYLDLSENKIRTLPRGVFDDIDGDSLHIELWMNRMYCDCNLEWFKTWIEELEEIDPMTDIRFMCFRPWRIHGKISDKLHPKDFQCEKNDEKSAPTEDREEAEEEYYAYEYGHGTSCSTGSIAAAVLLTAISTLLLVLIARWCFVRRKKGYSQYRPTDDAPLDVDM